MNVPMASAQLQDETKTIPLKILVDRQSNKVVFVEASKDFVDTLFSFLSLPLATIFRLLDTTNNDQEQLSKSSQFLDNIKHLYQTVQNINSNDVWNNPVCQQMLLHPKNPCESLCMKLFLNIDDTEPTMFFVCDSYFCYKFTTFQNLHCTCGKPTKGQPKNLDSEGQLDSTSEDALNGAFVRENGSTFLVSDDLKIVPSSYMSYLQLLMELGYSDLTQIEEVTHNIGKQEILNILKYTLTSHAPLTNTILASSTKYIDNPSNQSSLAVKVIPCTSKKGKMDVKVLQSKSQKKVIIAEANGDFVNFIFSFLTLPLGSIIKLLGDNSFIGCAGNLYKSVQNLDSSFCTDSRTVLLHPGAAPLFGFPNQPLSIPHVEYPTYYYGTGKADRGFDIFYDRYVTTEIKVDGGVISKNKESIYNARTLTPLDPKSVNRSKESVVGFVKSPALYGVGDDLNVKPLSVYSRLSHLKELNLPLDDLEVKVISFGEAEALSFLRTFLTSKFTLTSGLGDLLNVPKQENPLL